MRPNIRQSVTVYIRYENRESWLIKPLRRILTNAVVMEQGNTIARQTGQTLRESAFVQCFSELDMIYVPLHEWMRLEESDTEGRWSVDISAPQTIIVDHAASYEFAWGTPAQVTVAENDFIRNTSGAKRVASIEDNRRGTSRAQHILLRC